jgi:dTDP-4-dehydrorhamnose reductase
MMARVLVTGATGQLGQAIVRAYRADADVTALSRDDLDITDDAAVGRAVAAARPSLVVNCASDNDVDGAETSPLRALAVNAFGVRALARAADAASATLVHYSTDFVFDGTTDRPYVETDDTNPQSVYAASKLLGEWFAGEAARGYGLRVESLFGDSEGVRSRQGSLDRIVTAIESGVEVPVFTDRTVSPSFIDDIVWATRALVAAGAGRGLYHCVNSGAASWHEIALEAARLLGREGRFRPVTLADVALRAPRPKYCALSNARLGSLGILMPTWQDALARYLRLRK